MAVFGAVRMLALSRAWLAARRGGCATGCATGCAQLRALAYRGTYERRRIDPDRSARSREDDHRPCAGTDLPALRAPAHGRFLARIASGAIPPYLPEADEQNQTVVRVIRQAAFGYTAGGFTTVIDGIIGPWTLEHFDASNDVAELPRLHYVVLRPDREEALPGAQARTAADALVDEAPIRSMWDQFAALGALESHVIDTTGHAPGDTLRAVADAIAGGRFLLGTAGP